jgi:Tfp pilus assembly protein PilX
MIRSVKQNGFVSLFTCIMISLLLVIITVGMISLETLQLRKSEDAEQSLRAYYTAEGGVEDAVAQIIAGTITPILNNNKCNSTTTYDPAGDSEWTCQEVTFAGSPTGNLTTPDNAVTVDPGNTVPAYNSVVIEWDQSSNPNAAKYNVPLGSGLPTAAAYTSNYLAAPIELSIVQYPNTPFTAGDPNLTLENALIVPTTIGSGSINYKAANFTTNGPFQGNCAPRVFTGAPAINGLTGYNCYAVINNFSPAFDYLFRIRSRYMPSSYRMTFYRGNGGSGAVVPVNDGTATIDVTAYAGATYRRVIAKLPSTTGAAGGLNYVMYSDTNICKDFDVINNAPVAPYPCP